MDEQLKVIDQVTTTAVDLGMKFGPKVLVAIVMLVAGHFAGRWVIRAMRPTLNRLQLEPPVRMLMERVVRLLVLGLFLIMALQNLGVELLPLIAGLGIAGAGVALALQGVLSNVAAGLNIIFSRPFRVGEYISILQVEGEVLDISLFNTTLGHADMSKVVIPNRKIVGEILHNYGRIRMIELEVAVAYGTDANLAIAIVREVLEANARVLREPAPGVQVNRLAESGVLVGTYLWVKAPDYTTVPGELNKAILEAFRARGIVIPAPQREVRLLQTGTAVLAGRSAA